MQAPAELVWGPLFEAHPLAHFVYCPQTLRLLEANRAAVERYGHTREALLRLTRIDLLLASEVEPLRDFLAGVPASEQRQPQRVWLERTRDGRVLHADVRGMAVSFRGRAARLAAVVDAGARTQLAADAEQARDLLEVAGRMAQLGAWSVDLRTRRLHWSAQVCAIHELAPGSEYELEAALRFYPGAAATALAEAVSQCALAGAPFDLELPFVGARGGRRWVRVVGAALRDGHGRIVGIEGAQQDITQRKQDALALDEARTRQAGLLAAMPDLWFVVDAEGRFGEVSDPAHPSLARPWPERQGRLIEQALDSGQAAGLRLLIAQAQASGQTQVQRYEQVVRSGQRRSFEGRCVALRGGGALMLVRDVTEAQQLEQRFQAMADAVTMGIYMSDMQGLVTYTNPAFQRLFGMAAEAALGNGWVQAVHADDRRSVIGGWATATAATRGFETEFRIADGTSGWRLALGHSRPIVRADGAVVGHVGTVVDVTQARELEAARRARAVAEESGRRQTLFMSRVSHELRTPLNAILGFGQLLQDSPGSLDERSRGWAAHLVGAGRHMLALVDDLLELQRMEQGGLRPRREPVNLAELMASCADMLRPQIEAAGLVLALEPAAGAPVVDSDERFLRQMLLNLASNAIKYGRTPGRGGCLTLAVRDAAQALDLVVADDGPGMSALQLQRLFQPFERLGQETGSQQGSGLGLVITRQLAQLLGAEVLLDSRPGAGTVATVRLPR